ncbi:MAG: hypothetical protein OQJ98_03255 [Candidatus Pacebacteria bacterium]|nr:hypothetical protein [Candidatus Paceibacterota bacterium]
MSKKPKSMTKPDAERIKKTAKENPESKTAQTGFDKRAEGAALQKKPGK